jgi:hypothetical protein
MAGVKTPAEPPKSEAEKARLRREAKLAAALRDNLRRRKGPVAPSGDDEAE